MKYIEVFSEHCGGMVTVDISGGSSGIVFSSDGWSDSTGWGNSWNDSGINWDNTTWDNSWENSWDNSWNNDWSNGWDNS